MLHTCQRGPNCAFLWEISNILKKTGGKDLDIQTPHWNILFLFLQEESIK